MGTSTIFYLLSVLLSLYCAYLAAFRTYEMKFDASKGDYVTTDERISYPRLIYILLIALSFAPIVNVMLCIVFFVLSLVGRSVGDFYVKSWLLDRPEDKEGA